MKIKTFRNILLITIAIFWEQRFVFQAGSISVLFQAFLCSIVHVKVE